MLSFRCVMPVLLILASHIPAGAETLSEAARAALATDPRVMAARAEVTTTLARAQLTGRAAIPQVYVDLGAGKMRYDSVNTRFSGNDETFYGRREATLVANWQLMDFGATNARVGAASSRSDASAERGHRIEQLTLLDVVGAYLEVWRARQLVALAEENRQTHQTFADVLSQRARASVSSQTRYEEMLVRRYFIDEELAELDTRLQQAQESFRLIVGRLPSGTLELPGDPLAGIALQDVSALIAQAMNSHPELKADQALLEAANKDLEAARVAGRPVLSLEARHGYDNFNPSSLGGSSPVRETSLMLRARWTLYGDMVSEQRREATGLRTKAEAECARRAREIERSVRLAIANVNTTRNLMARLSDPEKGRLALTEAVWQASSSVLNDKSKRDEDLFRAAEARRSLASAQAAKVNILYDKMRADYALLDALGVLKERIIQD